jgi:hypothetical protein
VQHRSPADYDRDDNDNTVYPFAPELCDGKDNDQDGSVDEYVTETYYRDGDGDRYGSDQTIQACSLPVGYSYSSGDLDDNDKTIYPRAPELCDGKDNNQNGTIDENCPAFGARMGASAESGQARRPVSTLYPNPAVEELTIELSRPVSRLKSVKVSSLIDQTVLLRNYAVAEGDKIRMRVSQLKPGLYIIRIDFGDGYETLKFIKH